jgi:predicted transcriptional regulator
MEKAIGKELLSHLLQLEQPQQEKVLQYIKQLLQEEESDLSEKLSSEQISSIERGLQQIKEGKTIPHEEVKKRYQKWL